MSTTDRLIAECAADASHLARCGAAPWIWWRVDSSGLTLAVGRIDELASRAGNGWSLLIAYPVPADVPFSHYAEYIGPHVALLASRIALIFTGEA